jgi:putative membrane protein
MPMYPHYWGWGLMWFCWTFFIALIAIGIFLVFRKRDHYYHHGWGDNETALDILKKRYARGEITKDDFDRMRKDIGA